MLNMCYRHNTSRNKVTTLAQVVRHTKCYIFRSPLKVLSVLGDNFSRFSGSQNVARKIMQAASVHLTPVTLELGGKCPCFIDGGLDVTASARRLVWAKFFNAGQSCVAPDYVLCSEATRDALLPALRQVLEEFYTKEPQKCADVSRIVSLRHWTRLMELLEKSKGKVVVGGESNKEDKYIGGLRRVEYNSV